jgi:hypothetical protein
VGSAEGSFVCWGRFNPSEYQIGTALDICDKTLWMLAIVTARFLLILEMRQVKRQKFWIFYNL